MKLTDLQYVLMNTTTNTLIRASGISIEILQKSKVNKDIPVSDFTTLLELLKTATGCLSNMGSTQSESEKS